MFKRALWLQRASLFNQIGGKYRTSKKTKSGYKGATVVLAETKLVSY
jgi:hypothetical protein